jgi:hypothetical protein
MMTLLPGGGQHHGIGQIILQIHLVFTFSGKHQTGHLHTGMDITK